MMLEIITAIIIFCIDLFSKTLVLKNMYLGESLELIPNIFHLTYVQNTGVAFGVMHGKNILVLNLLLILFPILLFFMRNEIKHFYDSYKQFILFRLAVGFFIAGALGNIFDRIFRGFVVDMFDFLIWPVFNVADSFICISIIIFAYFMVFRKKR